MTDPNLAPASADFANKWLARLLFLGFAIVAGGLLAEACTGGVQ